MEVVECWGDGGVEKVVECWEGGGVGKVVGLKRWRRGLNDRGMVGLEWWGWDGSGMVGHKFHE